MYLKKFSVLFLILFHLGFSQIDSKNSILFIGNSLTYTNDLPKLVQKEAKRRGSRLKQKSSQVAAEIIVKTLFPD